MAANPERGEVDVELGGSPFTLALTTSAMVGLQKRTGLTYGETVAKLVTLGYVEASELLFALLQRHHAKQFRKVEDVYDLIDADGIGGVTKPFGEIFALNRKKNDKPAQEGDDVNPPQPGTGNSST